MAIGLRLPTALSRAPLGFDDGVYLASAGALRDGGLPFVDVYSSQGPAFLPLLWLGDLLGLRTSVSPRLLPVAAGVALTILVYVIALRVSDRAGAVIASLLVATSGCLLYSTSRIESDGVAMAFAAGAVLAASRPGVRREGVAAVLLGVAVSVKSLLVAPAGLAVLWIIGRRRGWRPAALVGVASAGVLVALSLPWGLRAVWDQSILLHLDATEGFDVSANRELVYWGLRHRDRLLLATAAVTVVWSVVRAVAGGRRPMRAEPASPGAADLHVALWIWMLGSAAVLVGHQPLFLQHLAVVVPPAALLVAMHRPPVVVVVAVAVLLLPSHGAGAQWRRTPVVPEADQRAAIDLLRRIEPRSGMVISDAAELAWLAGRTSPGWVVDVSFVRIGAGQLTTDDVVAAAHEPGVCAVLIWSQRLGYLPGLRADLTDYRAVFRRDDQELWLRDGCRLAARP